MPSSRERWIASLVHAAPLLGWFVWWLVVNQPGMGVRLGLEYALATAMLVSGVVACGVAGYAETTPFVRGHVARAVRFHRVIFGLVLIWVFALIVAAIAGAGSVMVLGLLVFAGFAVDAFVLPALQAAHSVYGIARAVLGLPFDLTVSRRTVAPAAQGVDSTHER